MIVLFYREQKSVFNCVQGFYLYLFLKFPSVRVVASSKCIRFMPSLPSPEPGNQLSYCESRFIFRAGTRIPFDFRLCLNRPDLNLFFFLAISSKLSRLCWHSFANYSITFLYIAVLIEQDRGSMENLTGTSPMGSTQDGVSSKR